MSEIADIGLRGMQSGFQHAAEAAQSLSNAFSSETETSDGVAAIISLMLAKHEVQASAAIVKTDQELTKSVLDILA